MTQDEIIGMYKEVSNKLCNGKEWCWSGVGEPLQLFAKLVADKERAEFAVHAVDIARRAVAKEREACLKACDQNHFAYFAAEAIRARGQE